MRSHTIVHWFAAAGAASLLLTACSHGDKDDAKSNTKRITTASIMGAPDYATIDHNAVQQKTEEATATCMIAAGWQYIPVKYPDTTSSVQTTEEDEVEQIKREGFGIAYELLNGGAPTDDPWASLVDPNTEYVNTLSESEQKAYHDSLWGTEEEVAALTKIEIDPETGTETPWLLENAGCRGKAEKEANGKDLTYSFKYWDAMQDYYDGLHELQAADPRIVKLYENWSVCMKKAGFDYAPTDTVWEKGVAEFQARADAVVGSGANQDPMMGWSRDKIDKFLASASKEEINAMYNPSSSLTADQRSQLEAILADEVTLALADHTCTKDLSEKGLVIFAQIEETYALEHQDELEAIAASLASGE